MVVFGLVDRQRRLGPRGQTPRGSVECAPSHHDTVSGPLCSSTTAESCCQPHLGDRERATEGVAGTGLVPFMLGDPVTRVCYCSTRPLWEGNGYALRV